MSKCGKEYREKDAEEIALQQRKICKINDPPKKLHWYKERDNQETTHKQSYKSPQKKMPNKSKHREKDAYK